LMNLQSRIDQAYTMDGKKKIRDQKWHQMKEKKREAEWIIRGRCYVKEFVRLSPTAKTEDLALYIG